jgi:hypothetical protein
VPPFYTQVPPWCRQDAPAEESKPQEPPAGGKKRKAPSPEAGEAGEADADAGAAEKRAKKKFTAKEAEKLTVAALKTELTSVGCADFSGKKADLVARLLAAQSK